jgi:YesN/AraC family two-component response regulator
MDEAAALGVKYFLYKPYDANQLLKTLAQALSDSMSAVV